jgi:hypothetical protein
MGQESLFTAVAHRLQEPKRQSLKERRGLCKDAVEQLGGNRIVSV